MYLFYIVCGWILSGQNLSILYTLIYLHMYSLYSYIYIYMPICISKYVYTLFVYIHIIYICIYTCICYICTVHMHYMCILSARVLLSYPFLLHTSFPCSFMCTKMYLCTVINLHYYTSAIFLMRLLALEMLTF